MHCLSCKYILFLTTYGDCVLICPNNTYEFDLNKTCLKNCIKL